MDKKDYLDNLHQWQACSHPELTNSIPEELFEGDFSEKYKRLHDNLWRRITRAHGTLDTLEQLEQFPFEYIYPLNKMEFWRLVFKNFLDTVCLLLHGLMSDTGKDVHSIPSFKNEIMNKNNWLRPERWDLLNQELKERKFDAEVDSIADRVTKIRTNLIAHHLIDKQSGNPKESLTGVSLVELRRLFEATHSLFGALSFGSAYVTLAGDLMPGTVGGQPTRTCLDEVLDAVLKDSYVVNQPERRGEWWPMDRKYMVEEELQMMNKLRKRIGLPEA